uniref:Uncharacterized protein n=1 Tax=Romanomermis culicivorax TaxID=13658 RepID=A0A915HMF7_ROMCU
MSSLTIDKKLNQYDNATICAEVIDRAPCSNDITSTYHNVVMSDDMKHTNFNLVVNDPFSIYDPPKTWPIYDMKLDHQILEMLTLAPLYSVPNHNE